MTDFRYKAFVSYSWADAAWGKWLHQAIETYRTPAALIGKDGANGPVPARLHPLFKDREEEAAGSSIGNAVETALDASEFLIVVCSPRSAQSQWVNREIAWFKTHRDSSNILALIVDGEPGGGENECFPRALTHQVAADMSITDIQVDAPLAADARDSGDGKRRAKLKLVAAMLGVGLDELVNRDERRRAIRTRIVVAASLSLALVMSGLALAAVRARQEAEHQRSEADGLVEFMLTDLREKLEPVGRLDALDVVGQRALSYYAGQNTGSLDADELGRRSRALHLVGEVSNTRGDSVAALAAFRQAAATTGELLARNPDDQQRNFDHAQSVFWVGEVANERGEAREAERQWSEYKRLADRLVALDPRKPEWRMEVSYAETNLGTLYFDQGRFDRAQRAFADSLRIVEEVASKEKQSSARQLEIGKAINWLAKAEAGLSHIDQAIALHRREIGLYELERTIDPGNAPILANAAIAWNHVARLQEINGNLGDAKISIAHSLSGYKRIRQIEPANTAWQENEVRARNLLTEILFFGGEFDAAAVSQRAADVTINALIAKDPTNEVWSTELRATADLYGARFAYLRGRFDEVLAAARRISALTRRGPSGRSDELLRISIEGAIIEGDALLRLGEKTPAEAAWKRGFSALAGVGSSSDSRLLRMRYVLDKRLGHRADAKLLETELDRRGYRHPAYLIAKLL